MWCYFDQNVKIYLDYFYVREGSLDQNSDSVNEFGSKSGK